MGVALKRVLWLALFLIGCQRPEGEDTGKDDTSGVDDTDTDSDTDTDTDSASEAPEDADNDGSPAGVDCDDKDETRFPGATEICDGVDQDCANGADDGLPTSMRYDDVDQDGHGDPATGRDVCPLPGTVASSDDCDDDDINVKGPVSWYADNDNDGHGDPAAATVACEAPQGHVDSPDDCEPGDGTVYPGAAEICDGDDQDCDDVADDGLPTGTWYDDVDGDDHGDPATAVTSCGGDTQLGDDCDDAAGSVYPGAPEICDGDDQDCDEVPDNDPVDGSTWYADGDDDSYGDPEASVEACQAPEGYVADDTDCDDELEGVYPGAPELCDGDDNDCDIEVDEDPTDPMTFYKDGDGDGFGDPLVTVAACAAPFGHVADDSDCDDAYPFAYPGAPEHCDGRLNDCDVPWEQSAEDGLVTERISTLTDITALFETGAYDAPPGAEVSVCTATWDVEITAQGGNVFRGIGGDVVLTGGGTHPIIRGVNEANIGAETLSLVDGADNGDEAACLSSLGSIGAQGVVFEGCEGSLSAGTDAYTGALVFSGNTVHPVVRTGGYLYLDNGSIHDNETELFEIGGAMTLYHSNISDNAGGIRAGGARLDVQDVHYERNGGGLRYVASGDSELYVAGVAFEDNVTEGPVFEAVLTGVTDALIIGGGVARSTTDGPAFVIDGEALTGGEVTLSGYGIVDNTTTTEAGGSWVHLGTEGAPVGILVLENETRMGTVTGMTAGPHFEAWADVVETGIAHFEGDAAVVEVGGRLRAREMTLSSTYITGFGEGIGLDVKATDLTVDTVVARNNAGTALRIDAVGVVPFDEPYIDGNAIGVEILGGDLTCTSGPGNPLIAPPYEGVVGNTAVGVVLSGLSGLSFTSEGCDFGTGLTENLVDVATNAGTSSGYGDDAAFECNPGGCTP